MSPSSPIPGPSRPPEPSAEPKPGPVLRGRRPALDGLRGLLVLLMCVDHYGGALMRLTYQLLGFVSAAEGFFFLSGYLGGYVYSRHLGAPDHALLRHAASRAFRIWAYHVAAVLLLVLVAWSSASYAQYFARHWIDPDHLGRTALWTLLLLEQPPLLDVLPTYFLLILAMPPVLGLLARGKAVAVLAVSFLVWLSVQLPQLAAWRGPWAWPQGTLVTSFDTRAWQLLFVFGLWLGWRKAHGLAFRIGRGVPLACALVAAACLVLRHTAGWDLLWHLQPWVDVPHLGALRLVNFACLAVLGAGVVRRWPAPFSQPWLTTVGRHALPIFVIHGVVLYLLLPALWRIKNQEWLVESLAAVWFALLMVLCAQALDRLSRSARERRVAAGPTTVPER